MSNHLDYEINKELGECYLFMGDMDKAEEYYRKAISGDCVFAAPYLGLATIAVQRGNLDDAMVLYTKATTIEESDKAISGMGLVLMEQGQHEQAFDKFTRALELAPGNMVALNCLVREGYHLSRLETIVPYLEAAVHVANESSAVRVALAGCLMSLGRHNEARALLEEVLGAEPSNTEARELFASMAA